MKKGDEGVARELPEKYRRLNEKAFADAKRGFDEHYGECFSYERVCDGHNYRQEQSLADMAETRLEALIEHYADKSFSIYESEGIPIVLVAATFLMGERLSCDEWVETENGGFGKEKVWYDIDEMRQAKRIRELFVKLIEVGGRIAYELNTGAYRKWRKLYIFVSEYFPRGRYFSEDEIDERSEPLWDLDDMHKQLWADLQIMGKANAPKRELGEWAKRFVADYDAKHGFVELLRGQQRSFIIPKTSAKAWDILTRLFTANDPEGWAKLVPNWKSHFIRKIGSTSEIDRESDLVKIAAMIRPHTPGKGRASDGKYRFEPIRLARKNLK